MKEALSRGAPTCPISGRIALFYLYDYYYCYFNIYKHSLSLTQHCITQPWSLYLKCHASLRSGSFSGSLGTTSSRMVAEILFSPLAAPNTLSSQHPGTEQSYSTDSDFSVK